MGPFLVPDDSPAEATRGRAACRATTSSSLVHSAARREEWRARELVVGPLCEAAGRVLGSDHGLHSAKEENGHGWSSEGAILAFRGAKRGRRLDEAVVVGGTFNITGRSPGDGEMGRGLGDSYREAGWGFGNPFPTWRPDLCPPLFP
ncbi:MAG: hypothetical protein MUP64_04030 [Anaerolineae bacterium]|nr:hypothetical protein [Anaerolineae bacterium]